MDIESIINSLQKLKDGIGTASIDELKGYRQVIADTRLWETNVTKGLCRIGNMVHDIEIEIDNKMRTFSMEAEVKPT
jgi:hypothetical protein